MVDCTVHVVITDHTTHHEDWAPLSYPARQVLQTEGGPLVFVPFTPAQLEAALEAIGSHAGRLADDTDAPSDAYVPFASLQSYLDRFKQEVPHAAPDHR